MYTAFSGDKRWGLAPLTNLQLETPTHLQYSHYFQYHIKNLRWNFFSFLRQLTHASGARTKRNFLGFWATSTHYMCQLLIGAIFKLFNCQFRVFLFWRHLASVPTQTINSILNLWIFISHWNIQYLLTWNSLIDDNWYFSNFGANWRQRTMPTELFLIFRLSILLAMW